MGRQRFGGEDVAVMGQQSCGSETAYHYNNMINWLAP